MSDPGGVPTSTTERPGVPVGTSTNPSAGTSAPPRPDGLPPRALAPDLARGMMLLLIVLANIPWFLWGREQGISVGHPVGATGLDRVVQALMLVLVDMRALPMFALLFGYGMVQFGRAQAARETPVGRFKGMLLRRHVALLVLGALHAALLFYGDVLGTYGLLGLILTALFFLRSNRTIKVVRGIFLGLLVLVAGFMGVGGYYAWRYPEMQPTQVPGPVNVNDMESWVGSVLPRLSEWGFITGFSIFSFTVPIAILTGWLWARAGVLDRPQEHLPRLRRTAAVGLLVAWLGGVPLMLTHLGVVLSPDLGWTFMGLHMLTGVAGGLGYAAVFGLIAARVGAATGPVVTAVGSVGRRSLSAYLFQALCMAPLLAAWGLGLGGELGSAAAAGIAVLIWAISVLWCSALQRAGRRGPAEVLLRRVTYGRPASPAVQGVPPPSQPSTADMPCRSAVSQAGTSPTAHPHHLDRPPLGHPTDPPILTYPRSR